jgi:hypothetical protein
VCSTRPLFSIFFYSLKFGPKISGPIWRLTPDALRASAPDGQRALARPQTLSALGRGRLPVFFKLAIGSDLRAVCFLFFFATSDQTLQQRSDCL